MRPRTVLLALAVVMAVAAPAAAQDLGAVFGKVVGALPEAANLREKAVGVQTFSTPSGTASALAVFIADQFDASLTEAARLAGFKVVTRAQMCKVMNEMKLGLDDRFTQHKKLGQWAQADYIVTGQITPLGNQASVSLRMTDTETLQQIWARVVNVRLDEGLKALVTQPAKGDGCADDAAKPAAAPAAADRLQVKVWTDQAKYRLGDTVKIGVRVNRDAYVTLVNIGTSGDVTILYPNRFHPSHLVRAGQDVIIPPPDSGFTLTVREPTGVEQIKAIATEEPIAFQAGDFGRRDAPTFRSLDRVQTRNFVVEMNKERDKVAPGKWAEDVIAVEVRR